MKYVTFIVGLISGPLSDVLGVANRDRGTLAGVCWAPLAGRCSNRDIERDSLPRRCGVVVCRSLSSLVRAGGPPSSGAAVCRSSQQLVARGVSSKLKEVERRSLDVYELAALGGAR